MRTKLTLLISCLFLLAFSLTNCLKKETEMLPNDEDTTIITFSERGLVRDTRTSNGLFDAQISVLTQDSNKLVATTTTDSNGYYLLNFEYRRRNSGFLFVFEHSDPIFMKRTIKNYGYQEKLNDSTALVYLHRKSGCEISLINADGKQKNVMLFNKDKKFSKLLMNLRSDTSFYYLLQDYEDVVYFDYFPQQKLQNLPVRGSTSGDTIKIEFKY